MVTQNVVARGHRNGPAREHIVLRWYEFQDLLLTCNRLLAELQVNHRRLSLSALRTKPRNWPVSSFIAGATGVRRLLPRARMAGGATGAVLRCWTEQVPEAAVLHTEGEVDLATALELDHAITAALAHNERIIVDLSRLDYLDGSGIRVLENAARTKHGRFIVVGSKPTIHRLFDILKLTDVLPVVGSLDEARQYLRRQ
jgi:anti-anti-sigma factor